MEVFRAGNPAIFDAYFSFIVSGCVGLVQYWLKTGMKETPQQLARLTEQVIRKGIGVLDTDPFADIKKMYVPDPVYIIINILITYDCLYFVVY